jgi:hypothetical protein
VLHPGLEGDQLGPLGLGDLVGQQVELGLLQRPAGPPGRAVGQGVPDLGEQPGVGQGPQPGLLGPLLGRRGLRAGVGGRRPEGAVQGALQRGQAVGEPPQDGVGAGMPLL